MKYFSISEILRPFVEYKAKDIFLTAVQPSNLTQQDCLLTAYQFFDSHISRTQSHVTPQLRSLKPATMPTGPLPADIEKNFRKYFNQRATWPTVNPEKKVLAALWLVNEKTPLGKALFDKFEDGEYQDTFQLPNPQWHVGGDSDKREHVNVYVYRGGVGGNKKMSPPEIPVLGKPAWGTPLAKQSAQKTYDAAVEAYPKLKAAYDAYQALPPSMPKEPLSGQIHVYDDGTYTEYAGGPLNN